MTAATTARALRGTRIDDDVLDELGQLVIVGQHATIARTLDRRLYSRVNDILVELGGAWNRKAKAHVFEADPRNAIEAVIASGVVVRGRDLGWFPTPPAVVARVMELADVRAGQTVLEPSAGEGALALAARARLASIVCVELHAGRAAVLRSRGFEVVEQDFLSLQSEHRFDRIVVLHVTHALQFLAPGGRLVAVVSAGVSFRTDRQTREFRQRIDEMGGSLHELPEGAFEDSGTGVRTYLVEASRASR
jgi:hypothetical protein